MFESPKTSTDARSAPEQVFLWFVAASPFACMFVGVAALAGWVFGIESLRSCFFPDGNSIKATTAVLLILAGAALVRLPKPSKSPKSVLAAFSGLVLLGVAGGTLIAYVGGEILGTGLPDWANPLHWPVYAKMSVNSAIALTLLGLSLLTGNSAGARSILMSQSCALGTILLAYLALLGYIYSAEQLYKFTLTVEMALPTAFALLCAGLCALVRHPRNAIALVVSSRRWGGRVMRRLLPLIAVLWPLGGWVRLWLQREGVVDLELGLALYTLGGVALSAVTLGFASRDLNDADTRREASELALKDSNETLEARVHVRTHALEESEAHFRLLAEAAPAMIWVTDEKLRCLYVNRVCAEFFDKSAAQMRGLSVEDCVHPHDVPDVRHMLDKAVAQRCEFSARMRLKRADGEYRWVQNRGVPRVTPAGELTGYIGACVDVTELEQTHELLREALVNREEALNRETALRRELDHRVRNNLAGLIGLVSIYQRSGRPMSQFADDIKGKIRAMKEVHDIIVRAGGRRVGLDELINMLLAAMLTDEARTRLSVSGSPVPVRSSQASALAMIVQELVTNSLKHGALAVDGGRVRVHWAAGCGGRSHALTFEWREDGGLLSGKASRSAFGPPDGETGSGVGLRLIEGFARSDLRGSCHFCRSGHEWSCVILARLEDSGGDSELEKQQCLQVQTAA